MNSLLGSALAVIQTPCALQTQSLLRRLETAAGRARRLLQPGLPPVQCIENGVGSGCW